jgi:Flp pilus assembly CpaE family ATPase
MGTILLTGAKGGVGTSVLAANLAATMAGYGGCLAVDLVPISGGLDLLLGVETTWSWLDLLPVVQELSDRALQLASAPDLGTMKLLAAPPEGAEEAPIELVEALAERFKVVILDAGNFANMWANALLHIADQHLLVTTLDPPALRACQRAIAFCRSNGTRPELVVSQWVSQHPIDPSALAASLDVQLAAVIPYAPELVAHQVHFGRSTVGQADSGFGQAIAKLTQSIRHAPGRLS